MLDPHYLQQIADGAENIAAQLHEYIIRQIIDRMMIRIGRGDSSFIVNGNEEPYPSGGTGNQDEPIDELVDEPQMTMI